jgi:hypothetical protein
MVSDVGAVDAVDAIDAIDVGIVIVFLSLEISDLIETRDTDSFVLLELDIRM